jgi:hypothetical protein
VIQGLCWCEVADEPVVVSKVQPVKPSNGVEDKTELTSSNVFAGANICQKLCGLRRGEVIFNTLKRSEKPRQVRKLPIRRGILPMAKSEIGAMARSCTQGVVIPTHWRQEGGLGRLRNARTPNCGDETNRTELEIANGQ